MVAVRLLMLNPELAAVLDKIKHTNEVIYDPQLSENPLKNVLKIEIQGRGIKVEALQLLVKLLDENKSLYGTNYDLVVRFKSR